MFLTLPEAADRLEVSRTSIRRWVKDGRLRSIKLPSGHRRIRREDVEKILAGETAEEEGAA